LQKKPQLFFHCGSFDHHDLQSLKRLHIVLFDLPIENVKNLEAFNIPLERSWKYLSSGVLHVQKQNLKLQAQNKKIKICNRLATVDQGGQKNRNGKTTAVLICNVFLLVHVSK
jgi:exonuclease VII small subunit